MSINAKALIQGAEYDFLRENPDLEHICYLTLSGSHAYGTDNENSDVDLRGVLIERDSYLYGLSGFEQFEHLPTDTVIFGLRKFAQLCAAGNPNTLELLGTDESDIVVMTKAGQLLRENAGLFFSKRVITSFGEYANAQFRRLKNALVRDSESEVLQNKHLVETLNGLMRHFEDIYADFGGGSIRVYEGERELVFDVNLTAYPLKDFVGVYSEMASIVKTYNKLNHRNRKKDEPHLYKHAMHLIRLLLTGMDILKGEGIQTKRRAELGLLMDIRNGRYTFDEVFAMTDEYRARFDEIAKLTALPDKPDLEAIDKLLVSMHKMSRQ